MGRAEEAGAADIVREQMKSVGRMRPTYGSVRGGVVMADGWIRPRA